jgi:hypothetical protein
MTLNVFAGSLAYRGRLRVALTGLRAIAGLPARGQAEA